MPRTNSGAKPARWLRPGTRMARVLVERHSDGPAPATTGPTAPGKPDNHLAVAARLLPQNRTPEGGGHTVASVNIQPLEDKILVEANEAETTTASGIVIPDTAKEKPQEGTVLAVGPGRIDDNGNRVPLDVAEGDVVIYSKYGGTEVKYDGKDLLLLNARDILAVVTKSGDLHLWP